PTPEKYLTPGSSLWLQSKSSFMVMELGAPRPDWKTIFQGPLIVATFVVVTSGIVCEVLDVLRRNTKSTLPQDSRCTGTMVRPSTTWNEAGSSVPDSARQHST